MALGPRDTRQLVQLTGVDDDELARLQLTDGTTFLEVVNRLQGALGALNSELGSDPKWATVASYTDQPTVEYGVGSSEEMERHTEYGRPDSNRAETEGHMLPLNKYDWMLGWTWDYLRDARMPQIDADIAKAVRATRNSFRKAILGRLLKRGDDSGASLGLGAGGYSPGFATAAASTAVDFTPPSNEGTDFDSNHEHYVGITGGVPTLAMFQDAYNELREHGHEAPFDAWISTTERAAVEALTGFVYPAQSMIQAGILQGVALVDPMQYVGVLENFRIREVRGIPQYYSIFFKSYGLDNPMNPLRIRLRQGQTRPLVTAFPDPRSGAGPVYPLQNIMTFTEFGVGVNDRTAATIRYNNSATWADGTPT
jgi:uncharacterized protein YidB (DUF937 family)